MSQIAKMNAFSITDLAQIVRAEPIKNNCVFTGVSIDTRAIQQGDCFFALPGENCNGHEFVADAFRKGAVCAVVSRKEDTSDLDPARVIKVDNPVRALGRLAFEYRRLCNFKVIAITGSVGKTTTRHIIAHALSTKYQVHTSPKNFNNHIGLPLTLLLAKPSDQIIVAEIGANNPGEIRHLTTIAQPDYAMVTNVHPVHIEGFGNIEKIAHEKSSIAAGLRNGQPLMIKGSCAVLVENCRTKKIDHQCFDGFDDVTDITYHSDRSEFKYHDVKFDLPLPGPGNIHNALAGWAMCKHFDMTLAQYAQSLSSLKASPQRCQYLQLASFDIFNDCYNASPVSMENALTILDNLSDDRRRVFICADMKELGSQTEYLHDQLGQRIARSKVDLLITIGDHAEIAANTAKQNRPELNVISFKKTEDASNKLDEILKDNDIILLKGSRSARLECLIEKITELAE